MIYNSTVLSFLSINGSSRYSVRPSMFFATQYLFNAAHLSHWGASTEIDLRLLNMQSKPRHCTKGCQVTFDLMSCLCRYMTKNNRVACLHQGVDRHGSRGHFDVSKLSVGHILISFLRSSMSIYGEYYAPILIGLFSRRMIHDNARIEHKKLDENQHVRSKKLQDLLSIVETSCSTGVAVDIGQAAFRTTLNNLSNTIFSVDLVDPNYDSAQRFMEVVWGIMEELGRPNLADYFPVLKMFYPQGGRRRMGKYLGEMLQLFKKLIDERIKLRQENSGYAGNSDVLDILLNISEDSAEEIEGGRMENLFADLFVAGSDMTSSTVEWAMAKLLRNPETLSKAQAEIRQAIPEGRLVQESDLAKLPYLQAIVKETFRMHPPVPFLVPRKSESDNEVCGFRIPKGAQILVNTCAMGRDLSIWENPDMFSPERFLESSCKIDVKGTNFELIPFGAGRRICPGLPLGVRMVPIMIGTLIHAFDWKLEDGVGPENMNMDDKFGITLRIAQPLKAVPLKV